VVLRRVLLRLEDGVIGDSGRAHMLDALMAAR
jgi:hypothetical protein